MPAYPDVLSFVQHLAPTWRITQQRNLAQLVAALLERPSLCLCEVARAYPRADQPLHGRLKRLQRFLDNPRLDELALALRWLILSYRFGTDLPDQPRDHPLLPILVDTTYFEPFAALIAAVPCGGRALPLALTTYHRRHLRACFPPRARWPAAHGVLGMPDMPGTAPPLPAAAWPRNFRSQNLIEQELLDLVAQLCTPRLRPVIVADRGFARASLFQYLRDQGRDFVIRFDATTWVQLHPAGPGQPAAVALALQPGERRWVPGGTYHQHEQVPVNLLAVWEVGQEEPWYLASSLERADWTELCYRWRMRIEGSNRDEKTGVLLRQGGDGHGLRSVLHLHRLLIALCTAQWLCALTGLQAQADLADPARVAPALARAQPTDPDLDLLAQGPALPPPVVPHRGRCPRLPAWMRRFAARGTLSYVRLGLEVLRAPDLGVIVRRLVHWLGLYLWTYRPDWRPWQCRYRLRHWWLDSS
jgi:hypothetical protein